MKPNKIRLVSRYLRHRFSRVRPVEVQACVTNECNMKCQYCACPTLLHARRRHCQDCWHPYFNERKALFRFRWDAVKTAFRG